MAAVAAARAHPIPWAHHPRTPFDSPTLRRVLIESCQPFVRGAFSATLTSEQRAGQGGSQLHVACGLRAPHLVVVAAPLRRPHLELSVLERGRDGLAGLLALVGTSTAGPAVASAYAEHSAAAASAPGGRRRRAAAASEEDEGAADEAVQAADSAEAAAAADLEAEAGQSTA